MMKRVWILFLCILTTGLIYGQTNRRGVKANEKTVDFCGGKLTFQYKDGAGSDLERHGAFSFKKEEKDDNGGTMIQTLVGRFENGLRDGVWTCKTVNNDVRNKSGKYETSTITTILVYKNGYPEGLWKYHSDVKFRDLKYTGGSYIWGQFSKPAITTATCTFVKEKAVNEMTRDINGKVDVVKLNSEGYLMDVYKDVQDEYYTMTALDAKGIATKVIEFWNYGGKKHQEKITKNSIAWGEKFKNGQASIQECASKGYEVKVVNTDVLGMFNYFEFDFSNAIVQLAGDKSNMSRGNKSNRQYGIYILATEIEK